MLLQHVETIVAPNSWELLKSKAWTDVIWEEKQFQVCELLLKEELGIF